jgi:hypothetical protein
VFRELSGNYPYPPAYDLSHLKKAEVVRQGVEPNPGFPPRDPATVAAAAAARTARAAARPGGAPPTSQLHNAATTTPTPTADPLAPGTSPPAPGAEPPVAAEVDPHSDECTACGDGGDLICCDLCSNAYHLECTDLDHVPEPEEAWQCRECSASGPSVARPGPTHIKGTRLQPYACPAARCGCTYDSLGALGRHINGTMRPATSAAHGLAIQRGPAGYGMVSCNKCSRWCKQQGLNRHLQSCTGFSPPPMPSNAAQRRRRPPSPPPGPRVTAPPGSAPRPPPTRAYRLAGAAHASFPADINYSDVLVNVKLQTKVNFKADFQRTADLFVDILEGLMAADDDPTAEALLFLMPYALWTPLKGSNATRGAKSRLDRFLAGEIEGLLDEATDLRAEKRRAATSEPTLAQRYNLAAELVRANHISRANQALESKGLLPNLGPPVQGINPAHRWRTDLEWRITGKIPNKPTRDAPANITGPFPRVMAAVEDVQDPKGAFGSRMPRLKAAGMCGWRLEHVAHLVINCDHAAASFARFINWMTDDHPPGKGPTARFMRVFGSCELLPFRKEVGSLDPRPVTPPGGLNRGLERVLDAKHRAAYKAASGPYQFGYNTPAGAEQAVQLVRLALQVIPLPVLITFDAANGYPTCSNAATLEALAAAPDLRALVPFFRRSFGTPEAREAGELPRVYYYGDGRAGGCVAPTLCLVKVDGMGQGNVCSTGNFTITSAAALKKLRENTKDIAVMPAFIDDLTGVVEAQYALDFYDRTSAEHKAGTGCDMSLPKIKVMLPAPTNAQEEAAIAALRTGFRLRGVEPQNIITAETPAPERGVKLLGAPIGSDEFAEALLRKRVRQVTQNGAKVGDMAVAYPHEALQILTKSLSKRLDYAARQNDPSPEALDALGTADEFMLAVLGKICGEQHDLTDLDGDVKLPHFARALAAMAPSWGGLNIRPLRRLAETGILHLASLNQSLPRLLKRLDDPSAGAAAAAIVAEIRAVQSSSKPWAVAARAAYARLRAALASPMPTADTAALKPLLEGVENIGKAVDIPPLGFAGHRSTPASSSVARRACGSATSPCSSTGQTSTRNSCSAPAVIAAQRRTCNLSTWTPSLRATSKQPTGCRRTSSACRSATCSRWSRFPATTRPCWPPEASAPRAASRWWATTRTG